MKWIIYCGYLGKTTEIINASLEFTIEANTLISAAQKAETLLVTDKLRDQFFLSDVCRKIDD